MNEEQRKELEKWYRVYVLYKDTPYIGFLEEYADELFIQSFTIWNMLSKIKFDYNCTKYYTLEDTLSLCKDFAKTIDDEFPKFFEEGLRNGSIEIYDPDDEYDANNNRFDGKSIGAYYTKYFDKNSIHKIISLPLEHNIFDASALIHELYHAKSADVYEDSNDWKILTESTAITSEFIFLDYLMKNNICSEDNLKPTESRLEDLLEKARTLSNGLTIYKKIKMNLDSLKDTPIYELSSISDKSEKERVKNEQREEIKNNYRILRKTIEYYLGTIIALLNYKNYKEGKITIKKLEEYNCSLKENNELESLDILFEKLPSIEEIKDAINYIVEIINKNKEDKSLNR